MGPARRREGDMGHARLENNAALDMARKLLAVIAPCLREEERKDCLDEFVRICLAGLQEFSEQRERMEQRLHPGNGGVFIRGL